MAEVSQKGFDITEFRFLKPSWLIKYDGKDPIVCHRDHISQVLVHTVTIFHVDNSTNLFFKSGEHGKSYAAFIPTTSSSFRHCEVKKHADADSGSDNSADQNANNANGNNDAVHPNASPSLEIVPAEDSSGSDGGGNDGDDGNKDGGNGDNDGRLEQRPIRVHRIGVNFIGTRTLMPIIKTNLIASQFNSWEDFAGAIYSIWQATDGAGNQYNLPPPLKKLSRCWPRGVTSFGRFDGEGRFIQYYSDQDEWEDVKMLITDVKVIKYQGQDENAYNPDNDGAQDSSEAEDEAYYRRPLGVRILRDAGYLCYLVLVAMLVAALAVFLDVLVNRVIDYFHEK